MDNEKKKLTIVDIILFIIFLLLLALPGYLCYEVIVSRNTLNQENNDDTDDTDQDDNSNQTEDKVQETDISAGTEPHYEDIFQIIEGQTAYIAVPKDIDNNNPPSIVIYSHGSNTLVTTDISDSFIQDLEDYGNLYTTKNYIFAASNEHGENWGNTDSINDMYNLISWIKESYPTNNNIYLIGFSMGGLPTMRFVQKYSDNIQKVALLAPTTKSSDWNTSNISLLKDIDIKIWHGTSDVNIPISSSRTFISNMSKLGKDISLIELPGKTHFDLDAEYMSNILDFFQS